MFYQPMIDKIILDQKLNGTEFMTFCIIARHMNKEGKNSFPSTDTMALQVGVNRRSIQRSIARLVTLGYIKSFPMKRRSTSYEIGDKLCPFLYKS